MTMLSNPCDNPAANLSAYTLRVAADSSSSVVVEQTGEHQWVRYYCRVFCDPSSREFVLRVFHDATPADRARALQWFKGVRLRWPSYPARVKFFSKRNDGSIVWRMCIGAPINDPLVDLELEAMLDLHSDDAAQETTMAAL